MQLSNQALCDFVYKTVLMLKMFLFRISVILHALKVTSHVVNSAENKALSLERKEHDIKASEKFRIQFRNINTTLTLFAFKAELAGVVLFCCIVGYTAYFD